MLPFLLLPLPLCLSPTHTHTHVPLSCIFYLSMLFLTQALAHSSPLSFLRNYLFLRYYSLSLPCFFTLLYLSLSHTHFIPSSHQHIFKTIAFISFFGTVYIFNRLFIAYKGRDKFEWVIEVNNYFILYCFVSFGFLRFRNRT